MIGDIEMDTWDPATVMLASRGLLFFKLENPDFLGYGRIVLAVNGEVDWYSNEVAQSRHSAASLVTKRLARLKWTRGTQITRRLKETALRIRI